MTQRIPGNSLSSEFSSSLGTGHGRVFRPLVVTFCFLLGMTLTSVAGSATRYEVRPGDEGNQVEFESKAPMETFHGRTDQITGFLEIDPTAPGDSATVRFEVDLASLDTGIDLRNQHMRENHLETEAYPVAVFEGARFTDRLVSLSKGEPQKTRARGTFDLHGVRRPQEAEVALTLRDDGSIHVKAQFEVFLEDHEISRPKFLFLKLNDKQEVTVEFTARPVED